MNNKKGFTLVELLAVIVILGIIMTIATTSVIKNINDSKAKAKYIAAKEIANIAEAYIETEGADQDDCVKIVDMIEDGYLEKDTTNPRTGENGFNEEDDKDQKVCKDSSYSAQEIYEVQEGENKNYYDFDGYRYVISE